MLKHSIAILSVLVSVSAHAAKGDGKKAGKCEIAIEGRAANIRGFTQDSDLLKEIAYLVANSKFKTRVENIDEFNDKIQIGDAPRLEKVVRQETPYTISIFGKAIINEVPEIESFKQLGLVTGDPHFGNWNTQPNVFVKGKAEKNHFTFVDLDEVAIGSFALDLARYNLFLKASFGDLEKSFGKSFEDEFYEAYLHGLEQKAPTSVPKFVKKALSATTEDIREKIDKYAENRVESNGKFKAELFEDEEFGTFEVKNMKKEFLAGIGFNPKSDSAAELKKAVRDMIETSIKADYKDIKILDIAIPLRETGGAAKMQRYVVSTELIFEKETYRLIIELKENTEFAAWGAVIDGPAQTPAQRYALALRATTSVAAPFSKVVEFNDEISFLMRPRGYIDIEFKTPDEIREISLFDAYSLGLLHGGQGKAVSGPYVTAVMGAKKEFIRVVEKVADHTLGQLAKASGLKAPKKIKEKKK